MVERLIKCLFESVCFDEQSHKGQKTKSDEKRSHRYKVERYIVLKVYHKQNFRFNLVSGL